MKLLSSSRNSKDRTPHSKTLRNIHKQIKQIPLFIGKQKATNVYTIGTSYRSPVAPEPSSEDMEVSYVQANSNIRELGSGTGVRIRFLCRYARFPIHFPASLPYGNERILRIINK